MTKEKTISKNVKSLGWVSFFTDMSSEMIFPNLPIFLKNVLGANEAVIGLIDGVANSAAEIVKVFSGRVSDFLKKRKSLVFIGYGLSTIAKPTFYFAKIWQVAFGARVTDRLGKGIRGAPRDVLIAASTKKDKLGAAFGYQRMLDTLGAIFGTITLYILLNIFKIEFRSIFLLSAIPALIALSIIVFLVKEKVVKSSGGRSLFNMSDYKQLPSNYKTFLLISVLFSIGSISYSFFILKADKIGINENIIPIFYLLYNVVYAGLSYPIGKISDRLGKHIIVLVSFIVYALVSIIALFTSNWVLLVILFVLYGTFLAASDGTSKALVASISPDAYKATAIGLYQTVVGVTILFANIWFGFVWTKYGPDIAFFISFLTSILAIFLFLLKRGKLKNV